LEDRHAVFKTARYEICESEDAPSFHSCVGKARFAVRRLVHVDEYIEIERASLQGDVAAKNGLLE
jgi:hypothetical protein